MTHSIKHTKPLLFLLVWAAFHLLPLRAQELKGTAENAKFKSEFTRTGLSSFHAKGDTVNLIANQSVWGNVVVRYRVNHEDWNTLTTSLTRFRQVDHSTFLYTDSLFEMPLCMKRYYTLKEEGMHLRVEISTNGKQAVELGDVMLPVQWRPHGGEGANVESIFERGFIQKHNISLNSSFLTFSKPSGAGPFYIMMTGSNTSLEYFDTANRRYGVYLHSACTGPGTDGNWRMAHTSRLLSPAGQGNDKAVYEFLLTSVPRYEDIREAVYQQGLLDVRAAPGYTVPRDLSVRLALRLKGRIHSIEPEYPGQTEVIQAGTNPDGAYLYDIRFRKLGENMLTVNYDDGQKTVLEFFSTEPLDELIKKRSAFIVGTQQHKAPGEWWDGLYSVYDMKFGKLRGPEDTDGFDGWWGYVWASDDPVLGKAPFVAAKNTIYPDSAEIASLEYYIENFVWGKLQRTDKEEPYPYGIYGVPNWYVARDSVMNAFYDPGHAQYIHLWRAYDYPHIIKLYYHMHQIAEMLPQWTHYLNADEYFDRAVQTAIAFFQYPYEIWSWFDIYKWGMYNEMHILRLIDKLEKKGRTDEAGFLRGEWEKKAKYFIYDDKYPYRSEHSFDRTAFESSYALAKYAVDHPMKPDKDLWYDKNRKRWYSHPAVTAGDARRFMNQQHYAGLSVRGWHAPKYYLAGTDCAGSNHTHDMSYMSMMGGWSVLDYGLLYSGNTDWIELGYNSFLSSWSLMNSGDAASNYGYWYPGKEKDGSTGQAFVSAKNGTTWIRKYETRGVWRYDGEIDLGFGAAFHTARTIVIRDSVFGLHAYGGNLQEKGAMLSVVPRDGVRQQFSYVVPEFRYHFSLMNDGFVADEPLTIASKGKRISFTLENKAYTALKAPDASAHTTVIRMRAQNISPRRVQVSGKAVPIRQSATGWEAELPVRDATEEIVIQWE